MEHAHQLLCTEHPLQDFGLAFSMYLERSVHETTVYRGRRGSSCQMGGNDEECEFAWTITG